MAHDPEVTVDRRDKDRRADNDRRQQNEPVQEERRQGERRKVQRRRQIDPTTCERDYSGDEIEFMQALDEYKRRNGRMFPTCSEILEVIRDLGYSKPADDDSPEVEFTETNDAVESTEESDATDVEDDIATEVMC